MYSVHTTDFQEALPKAQLALVTHQWWVVRMSVSYVQYEVISWNLIQE